MTNATALCDTRSAQRRDAFIVTASDRKRCRRCDAANLLTEDGSLRTANTASLRQSDCLLRSTEDHGPVSRSPSGVNLVLFLFFFQRLFVCDETTRRRRRCHLTVTEVLNGADVSRDYHLSNRCVARDNVAVRSLRRF